MKNHLIFLLLGLYLSCHTQSIDNRNFDFTPKTSAIELTAEEQKETVVILSEKKSNELIYDNQGSLESYYFFYKHVKINHKDYIEKFNKVYLPVSNASSLLLLKARVYTKSGKIIELFKGDTKEITEDNVNYVILAIEGLEEGAELEFFYLIKNNVKFFWTELISNKYFTRKFEFEFISPENLIYETKCYKGFSEFKDTVLNQKRYLRSVNLNLSIAAEERFAINEGNSKRAELKFSKNIANSDKKLYTYTDAAKTYFGNIHALEKSDIKAIDKLWSKMKIRSNLSSLQKAILIENYMKTNISQLETSIEVKLADALKNNVATEFHLTQIYCYLFEKEKIEYELALTTDIEDREFDPSFESWNYLDKTLIYLSESKKYLDPHNLVYRCGMINPGCMNQKGLFVKTIEIGETKSALNTIKTIEKSNYTENYDNFSMNISFNNRMDLTYIKLERQLNGYSAIPLRPLYFYTGEDKRKDLMSEQLNFGIKDADVSNVVMKNFDLNTDEVNQPLIVSADLQSNSLIETSGTNYLFKIGLCIGPQAELYQEQKRINPPYMANPHSYLRKLVVQIPEGYEVKGLNDLKINHILTVNGKQVAGFISDYELTKNELIISINEYYNEQFYPLEEFENFRKVINASADFNKVSILFAKKN